MNCYLLFVIQFTVKREIKRNFVMALYSNVEIETKDCSSIFVKILGKIIRILLLWIQRQKSHSSVELLVRINMYVSVCMCACAWCIYLPFFPLKTAFNKPISPLKSLYRLRNRSRLSTISFHIMLLGILFLFYWLQ